MRREQQGGPLKPEFISRAEWCRRGFCSPQRPVLSEAEKGLAFEVAERREKFSEFLAPARLPHAGELKARELFSGRRFILWNHEDPADVFSNPAGMDINKGMDRNTFFTEISRDFFSGRACAGNHHALFACL